MAGALCAGLAQTAANCGTQPGSAGGPGLGGQSTPCKLVEAKYVCPLASEGHPATPGAAGTLGGPGHTGAADVYGAPGSGSTPGGGAPGGGAGTGGGAPPTPHIGHPAVSGESVSVPVSCAGGAGQTCTLTVSLTVQETLKGSKVVAVSARTHLKHRTVTIGSVTATLPAGSSRKLTVTLSATGRRLLSSLHTLHVHLTVTRLHASTAGVGGASSVLEQANLTLTQPRPKKRHR